MAVTSARLLRLLALLQRHRHWPGTELAETLEVSPRTLRRDVDRLRDLGYPVRSTRGVDGGYELAAGANLPPLVLDEREAIALAVGLHGAAHSVHADIADASVSALAKVVAVLPPTLRQRVDLVGDVTVAGVWRTAAADLSAEVLGRVAQACRDGVRLRFDYAAADGAATHRYVEPYRLVALASRWYLLAFDLDRDDWRTFRIDRLTHPDAARNTFTPRALPADDLVEYVRSRIEGLRSGHHVEVLVDATVEHVRDAIGPWVRVDDEPVPDGRTRFTMDVDSLDWPLLALAALDADFEVVRPAELVDHLRHVADRFRRCA